MNSPVFSGVPEVNFIMPIKITKSLRLFGVIIGEIGTRQGVILPGNHAYQIPRNYLVYLAV